MDVDAVVRALGGRGGGRPVIPGIAGIASGLEALARVALLDLRRGGAERVALLIERVDEDGEVADDDRGPVGHLDRVAAEQEVTGDRAVGRDVLDAERVVSGAHDGVLAGDEVAVEPQRALRVTSDRERAAGRIELRPLRARV